MLRRVGNPVFKRLAVLGGLLVLLIGAGLWLHVPGAANVGSVHLTNVFVSVLAVAALAYLAACLVVLRTSAGRAGGGRATTLLVLGVALAMRISVLASPPFLSSDLYRYVWDGRVQAAGINPYRYIPADPALARLRDHAIYDHVNRRDYAPTIYPPAAQLAFRIVSAISATPFAIRSAMIAFEAVAIVCLMRLLAMMGLPTARVLIYAWNPLAVWCFAGNGHVDAEAIGFIAVAMLAFATRHQGWTGAALGAAVAVKFLPAAIVPALWRAWPVSRHALVLPIAALATIGLMYGLYIDVGWRHVLGFLGAYGREEGFADGHGIWVVAGLGLLFALPAGSVGIYAACVALFAGSAAIVVIARPRLASGLRPASGLPDIRSAALRAGLLAGATMLLLSPHYPWYFPFLAIFPTLAPTGSLIWMSVSPLVLYVTPFAEFFIWPGLIYLPALVLAAFDIARIAVRPIPAIALNGASRP